MALWNRSPGVSVPSLTMARQARRYSLRRQGSGSTSISRPRSNSSSSSFSSPSIFSALQGLFNDKAFRARAAVDRVSGFRIPFGKIAHFLFTQHPLVWNPCKTCSSCLEPFGSSLILQHPSEWLSALLNVTLWLYEKSLTILDISAFLSSLRANLQISTSFEDLHPLSNSVSTTNTPD